MKTPTVAELRAQHAALGEAWAKVPQAEILRELRAELAAPEIRDLIERLRPMQLALSDADPMKVHVGNIMNILAAAPTMVDQRLQALAAH